MRLHITVRDFVRPSFCSSVRPSVHLSQVIFKGFWLCYSESQFMYPCGTYSVLERGRRPWRSSTGTIAANDGLGCAYMQTCLWCQCHMVLGGIFSIIKTTKNKTPNIVKRYEFYGGASFLDATTHLYKRSCPSVRPSVRPSRVIFERRKSWILSMKSPQMI